MTEEINRRGFLKFFGGGTAAVIAAPALLKQIDSPTSDLQDEPELEEIEEYGNFVITQPTGPTVRYCLYQQSVDTEKFYTVAHWRDKFSGPWAIPDDAVAFVGENKVSEHHIIGPKEHLEFIRLSGRR